ncbi:unnamed protein product [Prunus armeniaca]|uniref:Uncharacterized protein n=1 Tax=Prunus armeniaca TaxID=36596 RepID=A0A6J5WCK9_PRUAR|nr:hypothetical protein GBA52_008114 [Prunus armeniaca]CAB4269076.1 unnamed protein product [Prunus armeniaca]CAB4299450.1 unnamed protein product [Prunus armeniaca]
MGKGNLMPMNNMWFMPINSISRLTMRNLEHICKVEGHGIREAMQENAKSNGKVYKIKSIKPNNNKRV